MSADGSAMSDVTDTAAPHSHSAAAIEQRVSLQPTPAVSLTTPPQSPTHEQRDADKRVDDAVLEPAATRADATSTAAAQPSVASGTAFSPQSLSAPSTSSIASSSPATTASAAASPAGAATASDSNPAPASASASAVPSPPTTPQAANQPQPASLHSDSEDTTVESYTPTTTQPTRITVQLPRKTHADVVFYHLPTHRDALHHLSILRHIINASEHTDDNTAITYAQYAANPHTKKFYQSNLPLPATLDPLPFTVRCLVRCLNRVSQQKKVVDVEHVVPTERSAHVYSTLRLQVIQLYGSHPPVYPFAPTMIAPSPPPATNPAPAPTESVVAPAAAVAEGDSASSSSSTGVPAATGAAVAPSPPLPIPPEKQRPTDVVFFYLASYNDVMYHNSILSNVLHTIGQKDDKAYIPYSLYLASPRTTEHYPTGPPLQPACDPVPFTLRGVLSCLARVRRQRRAQKTQLTNVEPLERNGVVYARIREQVFRLYDGQPPSMSGLEVKRNSSGGSAGSSARRSRSSKQADNGDAMDDADFDGPVSYNGVTIDVTPSMGRSVSASSDDSVPGSPGDSPPSTSSEPDMLDHLLNASAAVNGSDAKLQKVKQRREAEKEKRRKRRREGVDQTKEDSEKEVRVRTDGTDKAAETGEKRAGAVGGASGVSGGEKRVQERERAERLYSKLNEHGSSLPDRDTFLKLWEACH